MNYNKEDIPKEWYDTMRDEIDWSGYDEEDFHHAWVEEEGGNRREMVFNSIINNLLYLKYVNIICTYKHIINSNPNLKIVVLLVKNFFLGS
jgi:hypothetical protein